MMLFLLSLFLFSSTVQGKGYTVVVKTSGDNWAGTDATVKIRVRGTKTQIERALPGDLRYFEEGRTDTFSFEDYNTGRVKEMDVYRDESGFFPNWKLDWIKIQIAGDPEDSIFNYYGWVRKDHWTPLTLSCSQGVKVNNKGYCGDVIDEDECVVNNPCISPATCRNIVGSYACDCPNGYERKSQNECRDKNECTQNPCNNVKSDCKNFAGGFRCDCKPGYENVNPTTCQNVNECANQNTHSCNSTASTCVDSEPGYWCDCKPGYIRGVNNKICEAISCGLLARPTGSILKPARCTQANANVYRDRCVMTCQVGYVISDASHGTLTCGSSGRWEGTMGTCNAVSCPKLAPISNGDLLPSTCKSIGGKYRHTCSYYCVDGYQLVGTPRRECQANGAWDEAAPTCKKVVAKPWISCPDLIQQDLLPGKSTADVSGVWKEPTSNVQQITISPPEISSSYQFPVGSTKVTWTASNVMGSDSCSIYVMIYDREDPTVTNCPSRIAEISDGPKVVTWVEPTFSDNVKVTKEVKSSTSGSIFQLGSTYVTYTAYDAAGNSVRCRFEVELKRKDCHDPDGPVGGSKTCTEFNKGKYCQINCSSGSVLYKGPAAFWFCDNGIWTPSDRIPDCVEAVKKDANTVCQETQIEMSVTGWVGAVLYCAKCPTGMHKSSSTDCSPCPAGTYNDQQGQLQCTLKCPTGTSTVPGAKSANDCKPKCSAGQFSNTGLAPNCQYCPVDTYQDKDQQTNCMPCPNGTNTLGLGADSLSKCGARPVVTKMEPKIANINEKEDVSVNCYASGIPTPTYTWKFLKDIIPAFLGKMSQSRIRNAKGEVIGSKLTIIGATYHNTGSYECKVTNTHGENQDLAQINVAKVIDIQGSGADEPL